MVASLVWTRKQNARRPATPRLLDWKPKHGKRSRGRPRKRLNDVYIEDAELRMNHSGITIDRMTSTASDRMGWRKITHKSC